MPIQDTSETNKESSDISCLLDVLPEDEPLLTKARSERKSGAGTGWNKPENFITPTQAQRRLAENKNYGFALGVSTDDWTLACFDVETRHILPDTVEALVDEHAILKWNSVHSGCNRLVKATAEAYKVLDSPATAHNHITDGTDDDIEFQTSGHCIGPGCVVAHTHCRHTKADCPGTGKDTYELVEDRPFAPRMTEEVARRIFDDLEIDLDDGAGSSNTSSCKAISEIPDYDETDVEAAESHMKTFQKDHTSSFRCLSDRLNGGTGQKTDLHLDNGLIDRSATDFVTISDLYGVMHVIGSEDEQRARDLAYAYYTYWCEENNQMQVHEERPRKWLSIGDQYQQSILHHATQQFDKDHFNRWLRQRDTDTDRPWLGCMDGHYSNTTRHFTLLALCFLVDCSSRYPNLLEMVADSFGLVIDGEAASAALEEVRGTNRISHTHRYKDRDPPSGREDRGGAEAGSQSRFACPTKSEVAELAQALDSGRDNTLKTYANALGRLTRDGHVCHAYCPGRPNGKRHVYYPPEQPAPEDAR